MFALLLSYSSKPRDNTVGRNLAKLQAEILFNLPALIWVEADDTVVWANATHQRMEEAFGKQRLMIEHFNLAKPLEENRSQSRARLESGPGKTTYHFDVFHFFSGGLNYYAAISAKAAVTAERDRKRFVQTLSESFAHLPIGVAVFDKERDLSLFNPALSALLDLEIMWLAKKPSLRDFLDRLHDKGALPEPRDFKSWRDQIIEMEKSAESDAYTDDWHMPNDQVFRVTGRSHPAGSVAFVFEDITRSTEVERNFRLEVERLYGIFDQLDSALVVFDSSGTLSFANNAFDRLWNTQFADNLLSPNIADLTDIWQDKCKPTPIWGDIRDFSTQIYDRARFQSLAEMNNGKSLITRVSPIPGGYTLVEFSHAPLGMPPVESASPLNQAG